MKQSVSPVVIVICIVIVVAVAGYFGVRALFPPNTSSNLSPADYQARVKHTTQMQQQNMENMKNRPGDMGHSGGMYQQYMQQQNGGSH